MNSINSIKIAFNALKRNKFRAFLTMLGIIIGVASVIVMLALGEGSKRSIADQISSIGTNLINIVSASQQSGGVEMGNSNAKSITLKDITALEKEATLLTAVSPEVRASGQVVVGNSNWPTSVYGANNEYFGIKKLTIRSGRGFSEIEIQTYAKVCVVGQTIITKLFKGQPKPIGQTIRFKGIPLVIIGILTEKGVNSFGQDQDDLVIAPYKTVQKRILAITHIQSILGSAVSEEKNSEAIAQVTESLRKSHKLLDGETDDFKVNSMAEFIQTFSQVMDMLTYLLGAIAAISLLFGGIGIINIMFVSVTERTREIGLRLSVGGRANVIMMQFLIESVLLSVFGGVIGIIFGMMVTYAVTSVLGWSMIIMPEVQALAFLVCSAIGIFFGWYPARKAAGLNPIDALRYE